MFIFGIDVGSVRRVGGFSWAGIDDEGDVLVVGKDNPQALAEAIVDRLRLGSLVALAFESPLSVPVPLDWHDLGRARTGEGRRSWSAGAGTGALATGLVQAAWTCRHIAQSVPHVRATTQPDRLGDGKCQLLIAEALVSAEGKPEPVEGDQDHADAIAAAKRLAELINSETGSIDSDVYCKPAMAFNLAAAVASYAGLSIAANELHMDVYVAKARPVT